MALAGFEAGFGTPIPAPDPSPLPHHPPPYPPPGPEFHHTRHPPGTGDPMGTREASQNGEGVEVAAGGGLEVAAAAAVVMARELR